MHHRNVLFDLDGTLTDPREGITRSIQYALGKLGIDEPDLRRLEHFIGPPLLQAFMQHYGMDEARAWQAVNHYRERFGVAGLYENQLFEGVIELLDMLVAQGRHLYIATAKPWAYAHEIARHFGFARHFKVIYGSELDGTRSDKAELIAHLLHTEGLTPADTLMIGDRKHDLLGAQANGLDCVAVGYGFGSAEELSQHSPTGYCATLAALYQALLNTPPAKPGASIG
ncbi:HAD family hydrolase [Pseudomonas typographi]|uniref:HAD family hydrolase n=1 Tax=Pseudomonas typographi TaxID=2715964 RepID=A0ABR7Z4C4_9PSED|nr:HAD family hydrolase [Pseudomonas typographi]MBD1552926.1 HAD family hydrolase [Pseudomonas typographi]MBD1600272.1 HAD family hydrolase [Pseudomonas typographi]